MTRWSEFAGAAPRIAGIFPRRHAAAGNLCLRPRGETVVRKH
ncbi:hypothetical protein [Nocardia sp. NRRL WC-3656]|nr:hypothetical protein [Nocardia sp. NRRL WC-3656]